MSDKPKVKLSLEAPIARVVLDRSEKLNALDPQMLGELEAATTQAEEGADVRVILLEGAGEKAFCVGADILAWTALSPLAIWSEWIRRGHRIFDRLERARVLAEQIAANAPVAVQTAKQLIAGPSAATLESLASAVNAFSDDAKEGLVACREKRPPKFAGH